MEALSFFLVRVPHRDAQDDRPERPAFTLFPRYHQSRLVRKVADHISAHFAAHGDIGRKYRGQVNGEIQSVYSDMGRFEELSDIKYTDVAGIFDIMAMTVIQHHLHAAA